MVLSQTLKQGAKSIYVLLDHANTLSSLFKFVGAMRRFREEFGNIEKGGKEI